MKKQIEKELKNISKNLLNECLKEASLIAYKVGKYSLKYFGKPNKIKEKEKFNIVTEVDIKCEEMIYSYLSKKFKNIGFIGEEGKNKEDTNNFTWIVDPIDGTTNYAHGYPCYSVSIGLAYKNIPILGVVYSPINNTMYKAHIKSKSYKNNKKINVSTNKKLENTFFVTGFYYSTLKYEVDMKKRMSEFENISNHVRAVRRDGSAALDLCYVAEGVFDGFFEYGLSPWDICAGIIIARQAGAKITDIKIEEYDIFSKEMCVITNGKIHKQTINIIANS